MDELLKTGKYEKGFISRSCLGNLLNKMGYNLKKVKRNKPLKKIEETDAIFENINLKKKEALNNENISLISIFLILPFINVGVVLQKSQITLTSF